MVNDKSTGLHNETKNFTEKQNCSHLKFRLYIVFTIARAWGYTYIIPLYEGCINNVSKNKTSTTIFTAKDYFRGF